MLTRVSTFSFSTTAVRFSQQHNAQIAKYQNQISSGERIQRASDDAVGFRRLGLVRETAARLEASETSINNARTIIQAGSDQLIQYGTLLSRARSITQQGIQSLSDSERKIMALEIDGLLSQVKNIANASFGGNFLFGGDEASRAPFTFASSPIEGRSLDVNYRGGASNSLVQISSTIQLESYLDGREVFSLNSRGQTSFVGTTGAVSGNGTDSFRGRAELVVSHDTTTLHGASGLTLGTDTANDTVIGQLGTHSISIQDTAGDGSAGVIRLNDGEPFTFSNTDTNLQVRGPSGEVMHLNTTSIAAGFNGTIDVEGTGNLSVDGGVTSVAIDFSTSQAISDPSTNQRVFVDSSGIARAGTEKLEFGGVSSVFEILNDLKNDLLNDRGLTADQQIDALGRRLNELEAVSDVGFAALGKQSASLSTLEDVRDNVQILSTQSQIEVTEVVATDIPEAVLRLQNSQALLEYTYAVTARLNSIGLLNFLQ